MTEDEAKEKVCPFMALAWTTGKCNANCIASYCMMWRWSQKPIKYESMPDTIGEGYCGLGGKP